MNLNIAIILFILFGSYTNLLAQTIFIPAPKSNGKNYSIETDSSTIRVDYHENLNSIREFNELKSKSKSYYRDYYLDTKTLKEEGVFSNSYSIGIWKIYNKKGTLESVMDYDRGTWIISNKKSFPLYEVNMKMKKKADSLIKLLYGKDFFEKDVIFSLDGSDWSRQASNAGTIYEVAKSSTFMMRYNIKLDNSHLYRDMIEFEFDDKGSFIPNQYEKVYGFEQIPISQQHSFKLTFDKALAEAKHRGFSGPDSVCIAILQWENLRKAQLFCGNYKYCILQRTNTVLKDKGGGTYEKTDFYKAWEFNPWTGEFIRTKQMKKYKNKEKSSGYESGLEDVK